MEREKRVIEAEIEAIRNGGREASDPDSEALESDDIDSEEIDDDLELEGQGRSGSNKRSSTNSAGPGNLVESESENLKNQNQEAPPLKTADDSEYKCEGEGEDCLWA